MPPKTKREKLAEAALSCKKLDGFFNKPQHATAPPPPSQPAAAASSSSSIEPSPPLPPRPSPLPASSSNAPAASCPCHHSVATTAAAAPAPSQPVSRPTSPSAPVASTSATKDSSAAPTTSWPAKKRVFSDDAPSPSTKLDSFLPLGQPLSPGRDIASNKRLQVENLEESDGESAAGSVTSLGLDFDVDDIDILRSGPTASPLRPVASSSKSKLPSTSSSSAGPAKKKRRIRAGEKTVEAYEWLDAGLLLWWHSEERLKEDFSNRQYKDILEVQRNLARLQVMRWKKLLQDDDPDVRATAKTTILALLKVWADRFTRRRIWHAIIPKSKEKMNVADAPVTVVEWIKDGGVMASLEAKVRTAFSKEEVDAFLDSTASAPIAFSQTPFAAKPADRTPDFDAEEHSKHLQRTTRAAKVAGLDAAALLRAKHNRHQLVLTLTWLIKLHCDAPYRDALAHALDAEELSKAVVEILTSRTPVNELDLKTLFGDKYEAIVEAEAAIRETNKLSAERVAADWIAHGHPRPLELDWESSDPTQPIVMGFCQHIASAAERRLTDKATPATARRLGKMTAKQRSAERR